MQVITKVLFGHLDAPTPQATTKPKVPNVLADELKIKSDSFKAFAEEPFKAEVVQIETTEDLI